MSRNNFRQKKLKLLMTEQWQAYKTVNSTSADFVTFTEEILNGKVFVQWMSNRNPFLWANVPNECRLPTSLNDFKVKIKNWKCNIHICRSCQNLGKIPAKFRVFKKYHCVVENLKKMIQIWVIWVCIPKNTTKKKYRYCCFFPCLYQ